MRILAIFDTDVSIAFAPLRKLQHPIDLVSDVSGAKNMLAKRTYDVILCQPYVGVNGTAACDVLREIKQDGLQSDVPFICCQTDSAQLLGVAGAEMAVTIRTLGGQGLIAHDVFNSKNLLHSISKCLSAAVGSACVTSAWR